MEKSRKSIFCNRTTRLNVCVKGNIICIEVKILGNTPTKLQEVTIRKLTDAGAICCIAYSIDDVEKMLISNKLLGGNEDEN